jgi:hypothetical protein
MGHGAVEALAASTGCVVAMAVVSSMGRRKKSGREGVSLLMPSALRWCLRNLLVEVGARVVVVVDAQCASLVSAQFVEVGARVVVGVAVVGVAVVGVAVVVVDAQCASLVSAQFVEARPVRAAGVCAICFVVRTCS